MNVAHDVICSSRWWARRIERELLPWALEGLDLGDQVLEIGPGFGATSRVLSKRGANLTVLEPEPRYCVGLEHRLERAAQVVQGDGTRMPFPDARFSAVVCFTMLHHVPSPELQDRLFAEAGRVLRPGGVFAGTDSIGRGPLFKLIHIGDDLVLVDPAGLPDRLRSAGLEEAHVDERGRSLRFRARSR